MTKRTHDHARPPRPTSSTTATRHGYIENTTARALLEPSLLFGPCQIGISPEYAPYQKPRPRSGFDNADIGPSLSHVSLYHTKLLSRTYLYDFLCDVTRFTHLVTSQYLPTLSRFLIVNKTSLSRARSLSHPLPVSIMLFVC